MEFILASSNDHKAQEFNQLFEGSGISIKAAPHKIDVVEDGKSFYENSMLKSMAYYKEFKKPVMSDDSGLVVPSEPNILGIYSARFAPECEHYAEKCSKLIELLDGKEPKEWQAYFVCYLTLYFNDDESFSFEGRLNGRISDQILGDDGFGYDPVFIGEGHPQELTLAQDPEWKKLNSHRARAVAAATDFISKKDLPSLI